MISDAAPQATQTESYEHIGRSDHDSRFLVTCEHASNAIPPPLQASEADASWLQTHWGWDIGAAKVARSLVQHFDCSGVLAGFSRLVCDTNRGAEEDSLILSTVEGHDLSFNRSLAEGEITRRLASYHEPYHQAIDACVRARLRSGGQPLLLSVHSFTPRLGDDIRSMEMGVIFNRHEEQARELARRLAGTGLKVAVNAPYSGFIHGLYAAERHGTQHQIPYLELEMRQDLLATDEGCAQMAARLCEALSLAFP